MPKCFVIMPYGTSEPEKRHYTGVYESIIVPAATRLGYAIKRSDLAGEPGNITADIIKDLAESEIVIADLTAGNANVFFELGIRHALRKSGTVHIIDKNHDIPFDLRTYRAVQYSNELAELPEVIGAIAAAMARRAEDPSRSDNPVHDTLPALPANLLIAGDSALRSQLEGLQAKVDALEGERDQLAERLAVLDPGDRIADFDRVDVDRILDEAKTIMNSSGEHVLLRLARARDDGVDAFVDELRRVLKSLYLTDNDFMEIANMCARLDLAEARRATLEIAYQRFPAEELIFVALAGAYLESPNPALRERARVMCEEYLGVTRTDANEPILQGPKKKRSMRALMLLFNNYFASGSLAWVVSLADSAETVIGPDSAIIRNKARALGLMGEADTAEHEFKRAIEVDPQDDMAHVFYSDFLDESDRYEDAYREMEEAILLDPEDGRGYSMLAVSILNRGLVRRDGEIVGPVSKRERLRSAVPLFLHGLEDESGAIVLRPRIVGYLVRAEGIAEAAAIANGLEPKGDWDRSPLEYLREAIASRAPQELARSPDLETA